MAPLFPLRNVASASDEALIRATRSGNMAAFAQLWDRHSRPGMRAAQSFGEQADPDDLLAEAFAQILSTIKAGKGPTTAFRPYLYTVIRNLAVRAGQQSSRFASADLDEIADEAAIDGAITASLDSNLLAGSFRSLPERWQTVLWYTEVDEMPPQQVAVLMGMSANGVSALAYRARRGLRAAWLQAHVDDSTADPECRFTRGRFGDFARDNLGARDRERVRAHLESCMQCRIVTEEARDVSGRLALALIPLLLGGAASARFVLEPTDAAVAALAVPPVIQAARSAPAQGPSAAVIVTAMVTTVALAGGIGVGAVLWSRPAPVQIIAAPGVSSVPQQPGAPTPAETGMAPASVLSSPAPVVVIPPSSTSAPTARPTSTSTATPRSTATPTPRPSQTPRPTQTPTAPPVPVASEPRVLDPTILTNDPAVVVEGRGVPGASVSFSRGGALLGTAVVASDGTWTWAATGLVEGDNELTATQEVDGYSPSSGVAFAIRLDTLAPSAPVFADTWTGATSPPAFAGTGEPGATLTVLDPDDRTLASTTVAADGTWSVPPITALDPSVRVLAARQTDAAGNTSGAGTTGSLGFAPVITEPLDGATIAGATIPFRVAAWADSTVDVLVDGALAGSVAVDGTGERLVTVSQSGGGALPPGFYVLTVSYRDASPGAGTPLPASSITVRLVP